MSREKMMSRIVTARDVLDTMRSSGRTADDVFYLLEEEFDWSELATRPSGAIGDAPG